MNVLKIETCLVGKVLTSEELIGTVPPGDNPCRCAVGQMLSCAGVPDDRLRTFQALAGSDGDAVWETFGPLLHDEYGIVDSEELDDIMRVNDEAAWNDLVDWDAARKLCGQGVTLWELGEGYENDELVKAGVIPPDWRARIVLSELHNVSETH